jgi:hypothetical protein
MHCSAVAFLLVATTLGAQPGKAPPTRPKAAAKLPAPAPTRVFSITMVFAPGSAKPDLGPMQVRLRAAFPEADELLQLKDGPNDVACPIHLTKGPLTSAVWRKRARAGESPADLQRRQAQMDVDDDADAKELESIGGDIKIVGRIDMCNGLGPGTLTRTRFDGCALQNGTFLMAELSLPDPALRGLVIAHEYGHNVCLCHTEEPREIMYQTASPGAESRQVTSQQCKHYTAPRGAYCRPRPRCQLP